MRSHALSTPSRLCVRGVFCEPAFPSACCLPSTPSAGGRSSPLGSLGFTWLSPAFPPSCPFRSAMVPVSVSPVFCSEASSVLRSSQTPCSVHRWLQSLDFPSRPSAPSASGGTQGLPVLAHDASTHARGLLVDRARSDRTSPILVQPVLPSAPDTDTAPGSKTLFRGSIAGLRVPLSNASGTTSRSSPHDSGSSWVASPSKCEFLLRYTMPVYPGASPGQSRAAPGPRPSSCISRRTPRSRPIQGAVHRWRRVAREAGAPAVAHEVSGPRR